MSNNHKTENNPLGIHASDTLRNKADIQDPTAREAITKAINTLLDRRDGVEQEIQVVRNLKLAGWTKKLVRLQGVAAGISSSVFVMREAIRELPAAPAADPIDLGTGTIGEARNAF